MNIFRELFYGNICECDKKRLATRDAQEKELKLYDKLKNKLNEEDKNLIDEFIDCCEDNHEKDYIGFYADGIITGLLIGLEVDKFDK